MITKRSYFIALSVSVLSLNLFYMTAWGQNAVSVDSLLDNSSHLQTELSTNTELAVNAAIPATQRLDNNFDNDETKRELQKLLQSQQAMMQQIETLKARIEQNESQTSNYSQQLNDLKENTESNNDELQSLIKRAKLGGLVEFGWRTFGNAPRTGEFLGANGEDRNTFDLRRYYLVPAVQFSDKIGLHAEIEFEDTGLDEVLLEESEFYYNYKPWLNFTAGLLIPPLSPSARYHKATERLLVDRPLVDQFVIPSTYSDLGVGINGTVPVGKKSAFNYELMTLHGFTDLIDSGSDAGTPVSSSIGFNGLRNLRPQRGDNSDHFLDNNNNKALFGRIGFLPFPNLEMGVGTHIGRYDLSNSKNLNLLVGDLRWKYKKFGLLAEYANAMFERGEGINSQGIPFTLFPTSVNGYFIQPYFELNDKLTAVLGWNSVDLDEGQPGRSLWRFSAGLRYNPIGRVFLKAEYQLTSPRTLFNDANMEFLSNALITQLTFDF